MKKYLIIGLITAVAGLLGFSRKPAYKFVVPAGWPKPVYDFKHHPLSEDKIVLGRRLFYETLLSRDNTISCNSCHAQYTAFTHSDHALSHGIAGRIGNRNSPALMNLAWSSNFMWDGSVAHLDEQAQKPICNKLEMDETMDNVVAKLRGKEDYRNLFYTAFGDSLLTADMVQQALCQFMLTLVSSNAKYDRVMAGKEQFTPREAHGYEVFKTNCASCHREPLFTNNKFENNGLEADTSLNDEGRMKVTGLAGDAMKFKVPTLLNVVVTYPYMHDGRYRNLQMVLFHYTEKVYQCATLSDKLRDKLVLTEQDKSDVILFLKTLTDEQFLRNKDFEYAQNK